MKTKKIKILRGIAFSLSVLAMSPNACNADISMQETGTSYSVSPENNELIETQDTTQLTINSGAFTTPNADIVTSNPFTGDVTNLINPDAAMKAFFTSGNGAVSGTTNINNAGTLFDIQALNKKLGVTTMNSSGSTDMGNMSSNNVDLSKEANLTNVGSNTLDYSKTNDYETGGAVGGNISTTVGSTLDTGVSVL